MGTDRNTIREIPCPCGKGCITITFCSPDHPYAHDRQTWREDAIVCGDCQIKHTIVLQGKNLVLISREDYEQTEAAEKRKKQELDNLEKCVWEDLEKNGGLDSVVGYLNSFKTTTAAYRRLSDLYICRDIDDFRKKFPKQNCTRERVKQYICLRELEKLLGQMQTSSKVLDQYFKDDSQVRNRALQIPRPIGEPILRLK